jgi:UMF1 family MFS transporter
MEQGSGGYIYSRVLLARLTTKATTAQHFGFMAAVSRVSGIFGPLIYGAIVWASGARTGLCALAIMSVPGIALMLAVDFEAGRTCSESTPIDQDGSGPDELE